MSIWIFRREQRPHVARISSRDYRRYQCDLRANETITGSGRRGLDESHSQRELYTTSVTLAEVRYGIERLAAGRRKELFKSTAEEIFAAFDEYVLPFDRSAAMQYADIVSDRDRAGLPIDGFDAQIAAICCTHKAKLATRNVKDFRDTGIEIIDPWQ